MKKNLLVALIIFRLCAERGHNDGKVAYGAIQMSGHLFPSNPVEAYKWFYLAGEQGSSAREKFKIFTTRKEREAGRVAASLSLAR